MDRKSLFDNLYKKGTCREKQLMMELTMIQYADADGSVSDLQLVYTKIQIADALTKRMVPHGILRAILMPVELLKCARFFPMDRKASERTRERDALIQSFQSKYDYARAMPTKVVVSTRC